MAHSKAVLDALKTAVTECDSVEALDALTAGFSGDIATELADAAAAQRTALTEGGLRLADAGLAEILEARPELVDHVLATFGDKKADEAANPEKEPDEETAEAARDRLADELKAANDRIAELEAADKADDADDAKADDAEAEPAADEAKADEPADEPAADDAKADEPAADDAKADDAEADEPAADEAAKADDADAKDDAEGAPQADSDADPTTITLRDAAARLGITDAADMDNQQLAAAISDATSRIPTRSHKGGESKAMKAARAFRLGL